MIAKSKTAELVKPSTRKTIFDEIEHIQKKFNYPETGKYDKVVTEVDRTKLKSNLSKAENSNFLESSMSDALKAPGVGNYNAYHAVFDQRGNKWKLPKN